ncbi:hypothetical protein [Sphingobium lactosutens]|uniref:hypothetical protein n=1 Tax=Sphingobium lactosutens TaxID=522773 RepID=UPI001D18E553|nr:hypothetical protein [Sphingobium lactosutens]MCC4257015.1 hypothetical protein [Sphingobium lactosutens]
MAENKPIELRYYSEAPDDATVFLRIWKLTTAGTTDPVDRIVTVAGFHVNLGRKQYLKLTLGNGLTWDDTTKSLHIHITNEQTAFIREDGELQYEAFVVWNDGEAQTIREGTVTAVRVG